MEEEELFETTFEGTQKGRKQGMQLLKIIKRLVLGFISQRESFFGKVNQLWKREYVRLIRMCANLKKIQWVAK